MAIKIIGSTIIDDSRNIVNAGIATVTSVSIGNTQVVSSARQLQNIASLDATTTATIEAAIQNAPNTFTDLQVTGISTLGVTSATNLTSRQLNVSGVSTLGIVQISSGIVTATSGVVTYYGDGSNLTNIQASSIVGVTTFATTAGVSTNLKGGLAGNIPYQSAPDTTVFLTNGASGTILQSNGVGNAPTWVTAAPAGAITGLTVRDEGTIVGSANSVSQLNFVGNIVSVASTAGIATITFLDYVSNSGVATYATIAGIATYATNAGVATYATNAGIATNIKGGAGGSIPYQTASDTTSFIANGVAGYVLQSNGGTSAPTWVPAASSGAITGLTIRDEGTLVGTANSVSTLNFVGSNISAIASGTISTITVSDNLVGTALSISGISTFTNGPVLIGSGTLTGTASQPLQVTGGAYVSGSVGIGTTNPGSTLDVRGDIVSSGNLLPLTDNTGVVGNASYTWNNGQFTNLTVDSTLTVTSTLNVRAAIDLADNDILRFGTGDDWEFFHNGTHNYMDLNNGNLIIRDNTTTRFTFERSSGNVGISSDTPTEKLDVAGNIKLTGAIYGPTELIIDPQVVGDNTGAVRIKGDLYVDGTQTYINSTTIELADFNVGIATTVGTDLLLDGAGIGIGSTNIRKTITWNNTAGALTSSEDWNLVSGRQYKINGTSVLTSTTLGSGVVNSSLTSVGTLGQLNVSGVSTFGGNVFLGDNDKAIFGNGFDLEIFHDGNDSYIFDNGTGRLRLTSQGTGVDIIKDNGENLATFNTDGAVELYYDNSKKFETTGYGATVFGTLQAQGLQVNSGVSTVGFLTATNIWNAGITTSSRITLNGANDTATGGGQLYLNGATGNRIDFNGNGVAAPTTTTRSAGTKIVLYQGLSGSQVDYAFGIETSTLWYSVPNAASQHRWYGGTTQLADLKGSGELVIGSTSLTGTASQRLQVTGGAYVSGNLGVGATNPQSPLHISGAAGTLLRIDGGAAGTGTRDIVITEFDTTAYGGVIRYDSVADLFTFGTLENSVVQYALNVARGTGNVGVGYSSLNSTVKLAVAGTTLINTNSLTGTASQPLQVTGGAYVSGSVGIGTTNPNPRLHVEGTGTEQLWLKNASAYLYAGHTGDRARIGGWNSSTGATNLVLNDAGGNVGIATTIPQSRLHIVSSATAGTGGAIAEFRDINNAPRITIIDETTSGTKPPGMRSPAASYGLGLYAPGGPIIFYNDTTETEKVRILKEGNVLIGTATSTGTASQLLQVTGGAYVSGNLGVGRTNPSALFHLTGGSAIGAIIERNTTGESYIRYQNSSGTMHAGISTGATFWGIGDSTNFTNSPYFAVTNTTGNVGIATTNPLQKLHVLGNLLVAAGSSTGQHITQKAYELNNGTLSWEGSAGQLFSITNNLTSGSIFSVNDVSGIPSIDVNADGTIQLAPYADGNVGIATTRPTSRLHVIGNGLIVGVLTATTFIGDLTGTATTATNVIGGIGSITQLQVTGISTFTNGPVFIGAATSTGTASQPLQVNGGAYVSGNIGIGTTNPTSRLDVVGDAKVSGVVTATTFIGALTGTATTATKLATARTFEITGDIVASPISFDGTGNVSLAATIQPNSVALGSDTTGDYVQTITGTSNQITVTSGTGESSTPVLSLPNNLVLPQDVTVTRDLQVNRNLNVTGNITLGGTTAFINVQELKIADPDIVLGVRTDAFGNDISNDTTSNHGGIAIASTEGNPLVQLFIAGIETTPATYKKIMWFKAGTFAGLGTDAWLSNYAVGIGSTQFPTGTRLAAGSVQFTENDLAVVRNINASGVVTATTFSGQVNAGVGTITRFNSTNATLTNINSSGVSTLGITTFTGAVSFGTSAYFGDNDKIILGDTGSFEIYKAADSVISETGSGALYLASNGPGVYVSNGYTTTYLARFLTGGAAELYFNNVKEFETTGYGATVFGILQTQGLQVSGVSTFTQISAGGTTGPNQYVLSSTGTGLSWQPVTSVGGGTLSGIVVQDEGSTVGTAGSITTLNFVGTNVTASAVALGNTATITVSDTPNFNTLRVTGISTFTNGPVLIGSATSTGTASQALQVNSGAYVSGNLGVGQTAPVSKLHVQGDARFVTSAQGDVTITHSNLVSTVKGTATVQLALGANNNEVIRINNSGNVGVGTTNPTNPLTVYANTNSRTITGTHLNLENGTGSQSVLAFTFGGAAKSNIAGDSAGNFLINSSSSNFYWNQDFGSSSFGFLTSGSTTPWLQVSGGNKVGIATNNATATLQVKDALAFETTNTTTTNTNQVAVDTFATATFRSAKYQAQITCPGQISVLGGITTGGRGYTAGTYNVTFTTSSGNGSAAQGTLVVSNGTVGQISVSSGGSGYTAGDVLTASGGSGLQVSVGTTSGTGAILTLGSITSAGIGYTAGVGVGTTTLTFLGGTGTGAIGLATILDGVITSSTLLQQPTTGTGGTTYYSGSNYSTASVLSVDRTTLTNTITTIASSGISTFTSLTAHGLFVNDIIRSSSTSNGLTAGTDYYVVSTPTTTTFTLGTSLGVAALFTAGTSLSIGFYRNSANAGGQVNYTNAISGVSTNYQVSDLMVLHNGTNADYIEYATIANNDVLGTFAADISGANARLLFTPTYPNNNIKVARQAITV